LLIDHRKGSPAWDYGMSVLAVLALTTLVGLLFRVRKERKAAKVENAPNFQVGQKKLIYFVLLCVLGSVLLFQWPSRQEPEFFQMRLVLDKPSSEAEQMTLVQKWHDTDHKEVLFVQKTALLDRTDLKSAEVSTNTPTGTPRIDITFTDKGAKRFAEVTRQNIGRRLAIVIDGQLYSAPTINTEISGGTAAISGSFSEQEARELAAKIMESLKKQAANDYPKGALAFAGYASPDSALESYAWAFSKGDRAAMAQSVTPELQKELAGKTDNQIKAAVELEAKQPGYTIQKREVVSDDEVVLHITMIGSDQIVKMVVKKIGNEWKVAGPKRD
jgi:hypothetical protein